MLKLNIRTYDENVRQHVLSAVRRICCAECAASNAPREQEFTSLSSYPLTRNDVESTEQVAQAFKKQFGDQAYETKRSEGRRVGKGCVSTCGYRWWTDQ